MYPASIPNYETSETQWNMNRVVLNKNEERLQQLQKKIGVAELAGGIAHHFNNLLTVVIGCGTLLQMKMDPDNPLRTYVENILLFLRNGCRLDKKTSGF